MRTIGPARDERIADMIQSCEGCGSREFPRRDDCPDCTAAVDEQIASETRTEPPPTINPKAIAGRQKPQVHHTPARPLLEIGAVMAGGARDYGLMNWRDTPICINDYIDAINRHFTSIREGEDIDGKSGLRHLAHIAASCILVMDAQDHGTLIDDRWTPKDVA